MRSLPSLVLLLALAAGCGNGDGSDAAAESDSSPSTPAAAATTAMPGESEDCRLAVSKWADRAGDHILEATTTALAFGESLRLENLDDPLSEIKVLCSDTLQETVNDAMVPLTRVNYELSLCAAQAVISGSCETGQKGKVRRFADRAASLVGEVRNQTDL